MRITILLAGLLACACTHTVHIEPPKEPIRIDATLKIEHTIKLQVDKDLDKAMSEHGDVF